MTKTVDVQIHDNLIPIELRKEVWTYINNQKWYGSWKRPPIYTSEYVPSQGSFMKESHRIASLRMPTMWMHRACFASDEASLKKNHPILWDLWCKINSSLGNQYTITGSDEDMRLGIDDGWKPPLPEDPNLPPGWRVYANGQLDESIKRSHGIHRDTIDVNDDTTRTILYVANLIWYPSWFAECVFYPDDIDNVTGDHQQYQKDFGQSRNFNIGWTDQGKIVSPVPGRIINYDGRTLHTTRPAAIWAPDIRKTIAFRVRKIN